MTQKFNFRSLATKIATLLFASLISAACVWYLVEHFAWRDIFTQIRGINFGKLIGTVTVIQFLYILVRTWRWQMVVKKANPHVRFVELYWITAIVVSLANFTPGQLGETLKIELLKRRGLLDRLPGVGALALERLMDLLVVITMGAVGLVFGSGLGARYHGLATGTAFLFACVLVTLYLLLRFAPVSSEVPWLIRLRSGTGSPKTWVKMMVLTVCSWSLVGVGWQVVLLAIDVHISFPEIMWLIALVTLGSILSLIPGGLGIAEVLAMQALVEMGIAPVSAQAGSLMLRGYGMIVLLFGFIHLISWLTFNRLLKGILSTRNN